MPSTTASRTRRTQAERTATTRAALLAAGRELFAERGFAATGRDDIAEHAGVTRGALYHHFDSKAAVAAAVLADLDADLVTRVVDAAQRGTTALDQLRRSCRAYIDACAEPDVARILVELRAIEGFDQVKSASDAACLPLLATTFDRLEAEGHPIPGDRAMAAVLLLGMMNEAAMAVAADPHRSAARRRANHTLEAFLAKLFA